MSAPEKSRLSTESVSPLGIIAGAGMLPAALVHKCESKNMPVAVVALKGAADVTAFAPNLRAEMAIGQGRRMIRFFHEHGVRDIVMIGAVRRPSLWDIRPDFWTISRLGPALLRGNLGDDGLLRAVRRVFEDQGFRIQPVQAYLPDLIAQSGSLGHKIPNEEDLFDVRRGFQVAQALGAVDVGQSVVVQNGIVLGVEAAEGTSVLIARCAELKRTGPGPVLVKSAKPGQDLAMDLPTIGPETVRAAVAAGFRGIAIQAGATLVAEPIETMTRADQAGLFVYGHTV